MSLKEGGDNWGRNLNTSNVDKHVISEAGDDRDNTGEGAIIPTLIHLCLTQEGPLSQPHSAVHMTSNSLLCCNDKFHFQDNSVLRYAKSDKLFFSHSVT